MSEYEDAYTLVDENTPTYDRIKLAKLLRTSPSFNADGSSVESRERQKRYRRAKVRAARQGKGPPVRS